MSTTIILLLVDDDELLRVVLQDALGEGGFEVLTATTGNEAYSILEQKSSDLRGLITDINLGYGADGWDVARRARELVPELPVVYMSERSERPRMGIAWCAQ